MNGCSLTDLIWESVLLGTVSIFLLSSNILLDIDCLPKQSGASWVTIHSYETIHTCDEKIESNFLKPITRD